MLLNAPIANIARCSLHDGPGIRTVVYFKGCGLRCQWCHNPETLSPKPEILFARVKCIGCGRCAAVCPEHHAIRGEEVLFSRTGCTGCGACAENCPTGALTLCGAEMSAEEVFAEVRKDWHYYEASGGGVTLSGGECLLYPVFAARLLKMCREAGIHTAIESAMFVPWDNVERVRHWVCDFFADLKLADGEKHRLYTGQTNERILENIDRLSRTGDSVTLRIPVIPGVNDTPAEMGMLGSVISGFGPGIRAVELLRYNPLAESKYQMAGQAYRSFGREPQPEEEMHFFKQTLEQSLPGSIPVSVRK